MKMGGRDRRSGHVAAVLIVVLAVTPLIIRTLIGTPTEGQRARSERSILEERLTDLFAARAEALLAQETDGLAAFYDTSSVKGRQELSRQQQRVADVVSWAAKRGVDFTTSSAQMAIKDMKFEGETAVVSVHESATLVYVGGSLRDSHRAGLGIRHRLTLVRRKETWLVQEDDYTDPLIETPVAPVAAIAPVLPQAPSFLLAVTAQQKYDRRAAVRYANQYCGIAPGCGINGEYNAHYADLTALGGDCTNFVSQVLGDPQAGGLPPTPIWNWDPDEHMGTAAWQQTTAFAAFLTASGYAKLIDQGRREAVRDGLRKLKPGDLVGYEEEGRIAHFAVITGQDPTGQPVVNSHTSDRYQVPWDLGWPESTVYWFFVIQ